MAKPLFFSIAVCFLFTLTAADTTPYVEYKYENNIIALSPQSITQALNEFTYTFIEFYAPWCQHCQKVAPEYNQAAQILTETNPEIKLCKADFSGQKDLMNQYNILGFPIFRLYVKGNPEPIECRSCRTSQGIIRWLRKQTGSPSTEINSVEDFDKYITNNQNVAVFFGISGSDNYKDFVGSAMGIDDVSFINTGSEEIKKKYNGEGGQVILFVTFGAERRLLNAGFDQGKLKNFIENKKYPNVNQYDRAFNQRIFANKIDTIFLIKKDGKAGDKAVKAFKEIANEYYEKIAFSIVNYEENQGMRFAKNVNVTEDDLPTLRILQIKVPLNKYLFTKKKVNKENTLGFLEDFWARRIDPIFKSQPIPTEKYKNGLRQLVGKNFGEVVFDNSKDVMVVFYSPTCYYSNQLVPVLEKVAARLKNSPNLVIASMDSTANEAEDSKATATPSVKFYLRNKKYEPLDYNSAHIEQAFIGYINKYATTEIIETGIENHQQQNIDL